MRIAITTFAIVLIALSSIPLTASAAGKADPDLSGNWVAEFVPAGISNGEIEYFRFTLQQTGSTLSGTWRTASGDTVAVHLLRVRLNRDTAFSSGSISPRALDPGYHAAYKEPDTPRVFWQLDREHGSPSWPSPVTD